MDEGRKHGRRQFLKSVGAGVPAGVLANTRCRDTTQSRSVVSRRQELARYINIETVAAGDDAIPFRKHTLDLGISETVAVVDMNGDGRLDIISGENWYEQGPPEASAGPRFIKHKFRDLPYTFGYQENLTDLAIDVNGDGYPDVVSCSYWSKPLTWWENPGRSGRPWREHLIESGSPVEFAFLVDIMNTGRPLQLVPQFGKHDFPLTWYELAGPGARDPWVRHVISPRSYGHGIGAGDVNGDGRTDIITPQGWLEAPPDPRNGEWIFHEEFELGATGFIHVEDVNDDGLPDLITSLAHDYGIFWYEQRKDARGNRAWIKHVIDNSWSQAHALTLADLNGDGRLELITGKRYYAHDHDPGANEPLGVYWYERIMVDGAMQWKRHVLDYSTRTGAGMQIVVGDVDGDGNPEIVVAGKSGLFLFENMSAQR